MAGVYTRWAYDTRGKIPEDSSPNRLTSVPDGTTIAVMVAENKTTPEGAGTLAGVSIRPTEAVQTAKRIMAPVRAFRKGDARGLQSLPSPC